MTPSGSFHFTFGNVALNSISQNKIQRQDTNLISGFNLLNHFGFQWRLRKTLSTILMILHFTQDLIDWNGTGTAWNYFRLPNASCWLFGFSWFPWLFRSGLSAVPVKPAGRPSPDFPWLGFCWLALLSCAALSPCGILMFMMDYFEMFFWMIVKDCECKGKRSDFYIKSTRAEPQHTYTLHHYSA